METRLTHILLLRHGQTDANATGVLQGHMPVPLNLTGIRQANLLANRLAAFAPALDAIVSSDLSRATQTAAAIATACGLRVTENPAWRERYFGLLEGKPIGSKSIWEAASGEIDPPGAEPTADMHQRVRDALMDLPDTFGDHCAIAVVTHGGPLRAILKMLQSNALPAARRGRGFDVPTIANGSIMHLIIRRYRKKGLRWRLMAVNDDAHLKSLLMHDIAPSTLENPTGLSL